MSTIITETHDFAYGGFRVVTLKEGTVLADDDEGAISACKSDRGYSDPDAPVEPDEEEGDADDDDNPESKDAGAAPENKAKDGAASAKAKRVAAAKRKRAAARKKAGK